MLFLSETALGRSDSLAIEFPRATGLNRILRVHESETQPSEGYGLGWVISHRIRAEATTIVSPTTFMVPASDCTSWLRINSLTGTVFVCGVYIAPRKLSTRPVTTITLQNLHTHLLQMRQALHADGQDTIIVCGDFNVHMSSLIPHASSADRNLNGELVHAILRDCDLHPIGGSRAEWPLTPTFYSSAHGTQSILDYVWGTPEALEATTDFFTTRMSPPLDHSAVGCTLRRILPRPPRPPKFSKHRQMRAPFRTNKTAWSEFTDLQDRLFDEAGKRAAQTSVQDQLRMLCSIPQSARMVWTERDLSAPGSLADSLVQLSAERTATIRQIRRAHKRMLACTDPTLRQRLYHEYCYGVNSAMLTDMSRASQAVRICLATHRSLDLHSYYMSLGDIAGTARPKSVVSVTHEVAGATRTDTVPQRVASIIAIALQRTVPEIHPEEQAAAATALMPGGGGRTVAEFADAAWTAHWKDGIVVIDNNIDDSDVSQALKSQNHGKAADSSGVFAELICATPATVAFWTNTITALISHPSPASLLSPEAYTSLIIPILKSSGDDRIENIRPITVAPMLTRVISALFHRRLVREVGYSTHLRRPGPACIASGISVEQAAFKPNRSADNQAQALIEIIRSHWSRTSQGPHTTSRRRPTPKPVFCAFIDWRRAFDSVNASPSDPRSLVNRLKALGVSQTTLQLAAFIEATRRSRVRVGSARSPPFWLRRGVAQGLQSSPTAFSWYTDYWCTALYHVRRPDGTPISGVRLHGTNIILLAYADDIVLIADTIEDLQLLVTSLTAIAMLDGFTIQPKKCAWMSFTPANYPRPCPDALLSVNGETLPRVDCIRYLGIMIDENLTMQQQIQHRVKLAHHEARQHVTPLLSTPVPFAAVKDAFQSHLVPTLEFGLASTACMKLGSATRQVAAEELAAVYSQHLKTMVGSRYCPDVVAHLDTDIPRLDTRYAFRFLCHYIQLVTAQVDWVAGDSDDAPPICQVSRSCPSILHAIWEAQLVELAGGPPTGPQLNYVAHRHKMNLEWLRLAQLTDMTQSSSAGKTTRRTRCRNTAAPQPGTPDNTRAIAPTNGSLWILDHPRTRTVHGIDTTLDLSNPEDRDQYFSDATRSVVKQLLQLAGLDISQAGRHWRRALQRRLRKLIYDRDYDAERTVLCCSLLDITDLRDNSPAMLEPYLSVARLLQTRGPIPAPEWTQFRAQSWSCGPSLATYCLIKTRRGVEQYLDIPSRQLRRTLVTWRAGPGPRRGDASRCPFCRDSTRFMLRHWMTHHAGCDNPDVRSLNQQLWRTVLRTCHKAARPVINRALGSLQQRRSDMLVATQPRHQLVLKLLLGGHIDEGPGWNPEATDALVKQSGKPYRVWAETVEGRKALKRTITRWNILQASANFLQRLADIIQARGPDQTPGPLDVDSTTTLATRPCLYATPPFRVPARVDTHGLLMDALNS